jgi:Protein of unknown function (DUF3040)
LTTASQHTQGGGLPIIVATVPLSEHERQILQEIEKRLYKEDPDFARSVARRTPRFSEARLIKLGLLVFVLGFASLVGFFVSRALIVGVIAFGAMVGGIVLVTGSVGSLVSKRQANAPTKRERLTRFFERWEERLRKRYKRT